MKYKGTIGTDYRGSVDGITGSKNASGNYFKQKSHPTNPNSQAQQIARAAFRDASKIYQTLTVPQKQAWDTFRLKTFNPFNGKNVSQYTSSQACTAIQASIINFNRLKKLPTIQGFGEATAITGITIEDIAITGEAPLLSVAPNILDTVSSPATYEIVGIYMSTASVITIDLRFKGLSGAGLGQGALKDLSGLNYGFEIFMSTAVAREGMAPYNPMANSVGSTGLVTFATDNLLGFTGFRMILDVSQFVANMKNQPTVGAWFQVTVTNTDEHGTQSKIGSKYCEFGTAAPTIPAS